MSENTQLAVAEQPSLALSVPELISVLKSSLYPDAADESVKLVISYCTAAKLDVMQKPVHIVPMWSSKEKKMRDVIMPGIGLYRTQAARSGVLAGIDEPVFGEDVTDSWGGKASVTFPRWCKVTVRRRLASGDTALFTSKELWIENYATAGKDTKFPNSMWARRPYAQLAKCAQAQALRQAFPEMCSAPTAEEMEGRPYSERDVTPREVGRVHDPSAPIAELAAPAIDIEPPEPAPHWQELHPTGWKSWLAAQQGGVTLENDSDAAMGPLWARDRNNPALCAWAASYIIKTIPAITDMDWPTLIDSIPGLPDELESCEPPHLWLAAAYLRKAKAAQDAVEAAP